MYWLVVSQQLDVLVGCISAAWCTGWLYLSSLVYWLVVSQQLDVLVGCLGVVPLRQTHSVGITDMIRITRIRYRFWRFLSDTAVLRFDTDFN